MNKIEKDRQTWERLTYGLDRFLPILANPVTMYVGGFALTNILEHTKIGVTQTSTTTESINKKNAALAFLFPWLNPFIETNTTTTQPAGAPIYALSADQANVARAGLVALAVGQSGLLGQAASLISKVATK